ncbi:MAG: acetyl-CoA carboxylase biotin carboxyl carrier protein [Clostridia bacterium]|nr:acetyl-CoA carboxylase biotin carboxyl carrier protein [Clostridia bacterium]
MDTSIRNIRALAKLMAENSLSAIEIKDDLKAIRIERAAAVPSMPPQETSAQQDSQLRIETGAVPSPMVGIFYRASSPDAKPFVEVGASVKKGDVLCIIEAMKLLNEITADCDGTVEKICVEDGAMVEYGQILFIIR